MIFSSRPQDSRHLQVNNLLPDKSGIRRGCGRLSRPQPRATELVEFKRTVTGFLAPQDWQILDFKTVLPALSGSTVHHMETSTKRTNTGHPRSPLQPLRSRWHRLAIDHPSYLFEHLLDAGYRPRLQVEFLLITLNRQRVPAYFRTVINSVSAVLMTIAHCVNAIE